MLRLSRLARVAAWLAAITGILAAPAVGQTREQLELLRQNPDLVRRQIEQSGLSEAQIRQRLQAAGFSPSLLDAFLTGDTVGMRTGLDAEALQALTALGISEIEVQGLEPIQLLTGLERRRELRPAPMRAEGLELFGLDVFRGRTTLFQPLLSGPVPPTYRIGPGDAMVLVLTGEVELIHELQVTREGYVVIPQVGQLFVNNLTMEELNLLLRRRLGQSYSGLARGTTQFDVTITRLRANQIYVVGEVQQPGAYQLSSVATVLNALYAAGGLTEQADFRTVVVRRTADTVAVLDLYDYLLKGDTRNDVMLQQGDVVFVPVRQVRASITGAVARPAIYDIKRGETLADLVRAAGGFRADAALERMTVYRVLPSAERRPGPVLRAALDVELPIAPTPASETGPGGGVLVAPLELRDGDSVVVDSLVPLGESHFVQIGGSVVKSGRYPWRQGMTLRDLLRLARGPSVGADLREAEVARLPEDRSQGQLAAKLRVPLDSSYLFVRDSAAPFVGPPGPAFARPGTAAEFNLEPYDQVTILRQPYFELQRVVWISGEAMFPGPYALTRKDERLTDLLDRAGGLTRNAYAEGARFFRTEGDAGRVNVDLARALERRGGTADIALQPGDSLHIPEYNPVVRVEGAVVNPTSVLYIAGAPLDYYLANAGGYARNADKGRVSVRYANGSAEVKRKFLFSSRAPKPGPGSVVSVPEIPAGEGVDFTQLVGTVAQVLTSAVAIIAIVIR